MSLNIVFGMDAYFAYLEKRHPGQENQRTEVRDLKIELLFAITMSDACFFFQSLCTFGVFQGHKLDKPQVFVNFYLFTY